MQPTVIVIQYKKLEFLPPVMALLLALKAVGRTVHFIGVSSEAGEAFLCRNDIPHTFLPYDYSLYINNSLMTKVTHRLARAWRFYPCRGALARAIDAVAAKNGGGAPTLWFVDTQSAALLGNRFGRYPRRLVSIFELAEDNGRKWWGFDFGRFLRSTTVVVPEYNRAHILKEHYGLNSLPCVVANKPSGHPRTTDCPLTFEAQKVFDMIGNRPVFLYQGVWTSDRADVGRILETIARCRPNYCVLTLPGNEAVKKLLAPYSNAFTLPYIAPPNHLAVTSRATVGIAVYNASGQTDLQRLNAVYCAPNKIYEYAGFAIPTLGNNIPGLKYTVEVAGAGVCCDIDEASILAAADRLVSNIDLYRKNATRFFDETDLNAQVRAALQAAEGDEG